MKLLQHSWSDLLILDHLHQRIHNRLQVSVCYMIFESENENICIIMENNIYDMISITQYNMSIDIHI